MKSYNLSIWLPYFFRSQTGRIFFQASNFALFFSKSIQRLKLGYWKKILLQYNYIVNLKNYEGETEDRLRWE